ncbi:MAG TPA: hypothetical protein VJB06_03090 [archaeon]|nr:hypothetical protein [archaeon]
MGALDKINKYTVYDYLIVFLLVLFIVNSALYNYWSTSVPYVLISVIIAVVLDLFLSFLKSKLRKPKEGQAGFAPPFKLHFPKSAFISGMIIGLLIEPGALAWPAMAPIILAPVLAILLKHIIRVKGDHIFNPANLGLLATLLVLGTTASLSWWGAGPSWLVVIFGLFLAFRLKRPNPAISFLVAYIVLFVLLDAASGKLSPATFVQFNSGTLLFFGLIMVQEPVTAARSSKGRLIMGILAAVFTFLFTFSPQTQQLSLLLGLFVADLFVYPMNWKLK